MNRKDLLILFDALHNPQDIEFHTYGFRTSNPDMMKITDSQVFKNLF